MHIADDRDASIERLVGTDRTCKNPPLASFAPEVS